MSARDPRAKSSPSAAGFGGERPVLLFDGVCNLCHGTVRFVLEHERDDRLRFGALQSTEGRDLLTRHALPSAYLESLVYWEGDRVWLGSDAVLQVARHLRAPWRWIRLARILPHAVREWVYRAVARNRYRWFGRRDEVCLLPRPEWKDRFLGS